MSEFKLTFNIFVSDLRHRAPSPLQDPVQPLHPGALAVLQAVGVYPQRHRRVGVAEEHRNRLYVHAARHGDGGEGVAQVAERRPAALGAGEAQHAREFIKRLVTDGRCDYLETGSLVSLKADVKEIPLPSEEESLRMPPWTTRSSSGQWGKSPWRRRSVRATPRAGRRRRCTGKRLGESVVLHPGQLGRGDGVLKLPLYMARCL